MPAALDLLERRWTLRLVWELRRDAVAFTAIRERTGISPSVLTTRLRELSEAGVVERDPARRYQTAGELGYDLEYHIYSKGYGPTIMTLAKYAAKLFPHRTFYVAPSRGDGFTSTITKTGRK